MTVQIEIPNPSKAPIRARFSQSELKFIKLSLLYSQYFQVMANTVVWALVFCFEGKFLDLESCSAWNTGSHWNIENENKDQ